MPLFYVIGENYGDQAPKHFFTHYVEAFCRLLCSPKKCWGKRTIIISTLGTQYSVGYDTACVLYLKLHDWDIQKSFKAGNEEAP